MIDQPQDPSLSSNIISVSTHLYKRGCPSVGLLVRWLRVFYMVENSQTMYDWTLTDHQTSAPLLPLPPPPPLSPPSPPVYDPPAEIFKGQKRAYNE